MWTRKAAIMLTSGISLILIGMMISHFQLMIIGLTFIAFLVINGWVTGHSDLEITRNISAQNVYKGDDILVEVTVTNNSYRRTQLLEVFDNVPHEMKMRRGINQMRMNLGPGQSATMRYTVRCHSVVITPLGRYLFVIITHSTSSLMSRKSTTEPILPYFLKFEKLRKPYSAPMYPKCTQVQLL